MPHALPDPDLQPEFYHWVPFKRLVAWLIDTILIFGLTAITVVFTAFIGVLVFPFLFLAVNLAYRTVTIAKWSATPGMIVMAIELRTLSGFRLDRNAAFLHSLAFTVTMLITILLVVSAALMLMNPRGQGLVDHFMGTTALNRAGPY